MSTTHNNLRMELLSIADEDGFDSTYENEMNHMKQSRMTLWIPIDVLSVIHVCWLLTFGINK